MKILVIGENGQLGRSIKNIFSDIQLNNEDEFVFIGRKELDLSNEESISLYLNDNFFEIIVNCAGYTFVDKAESEEDLAYQINHLAVGKIAEISNKQKVKLIHISTDYIFDGCQRKSLLRI